MSNDQRPTILLTGGTGVLGRTLRATLPMYGYSIVTPEILLPDHKSIGGRFDLSRNHLQLARLIPICPTAVIHAAAAIPHLSTHNTQDTADRTRKIDRNLFEAVSLWQCPIIYFSGCNLYEKQIDTPSDELAPIRTDLENNPYLEAKYDGDKLFQSYPMSTIFRISSPIGTRLHTASVLAQFIHAATKDETLSVWGSGTREQDFIDTRDIANAARLVFIMSKFGVFNVASGNPTNMSCLARMVISVVGSGRLSISQIDDKKEEEKASYSIQKIANELNWQPSHSLINSIRWVFQSYLKNEILFS